MEPKDHRARSEVFLEMFLNTYSIPSLTHLHLVFRRKTTSLGLLLQLCNKIRIAVPPKSPLTMSILLPYVENYSLTIIPIMMITHKDVVMLKDDPIEFIRSSNDFTETLFTPKNAIVDLLMYLC